MKVPPCPTIQVMDSKPQYLLDTDAMEVFLIVTRVRPPGVRISKRVSAILAIPEPEVLSSHLIRYALRAVTVYSRNLRTGTHKNLHKKTLYHIQNETCSKYLWYYHRPHSDLAVSEVVDELRQQDSPNPWYRGKSKFLTEMTVSLSTVNDEFGEESLTFPNHTLDTVGLHDSPDDRIVEGPFQVTLRDGCVTRFRFSRDEQTYVCLNDPNTKRGKRIFFGM